MNNAVIEREYPVIKSNELIQKSRFTLTVMELKILHFMISKIKVEDDELKPIQFNITDFCKISGMESNSGKNYKDIKDAITKLKSRVFWIKTEPNKEELFSWIGTAKIIKENNNYDITICLEQGLKPYLLNLNANFLQQNLIFTLAMNSAYAIRLYEILKSYSYRKKHIEFELLEFKRLLNINGESYKKISNLKNIILKTAITEINQYTDINVSYELEKSGRSFSKIHFYISTKKDNMIMYKNIEQRLN